MNSWFLDKLTIRSEATGRAVVCVAQASNEHR